MVVVYEWDPEEDWKETNMDQMKDVRPDEQLAELTFAYMDAHPGMAYGEAFREVGYENPQLVESYFNTRNTPKRPRTSPMPKIDERSPTPGEELIELAHEYMDANQGVDFSHAFLQTQRMYPDLAEAHLATHRRRGRGIA